MDETGIFPKTETKTERRSMTMLRTGLSPNFMGLASLGLGIDIFCDLLYSILLLRVVSGLYLLRLALSRPQVR